MFRRCTDPLLLLHCTACVSSTILCAIRELVDKNMKLYALHSNGVWIGKGNIVKISQNAIQNQFPGDKRQSNYSNLQCYKKIMGFIKQKLNTKIIDLSSKKTPEERDELMCGLGKFNEFYSTLIRTDDVNLDGLKSHSYFRETVLSAKAMTTFKPNRNPIFEDRHIRSEYMWRNFLGCGGSAYAFVARKHTTDRDVAIKRIEITESEDVRLFLKEIKLLNKLKHEHIVRYDHSWTGDLFDGLPSKNKKCAKVLYLSMEYCAKGNLRDVIERGDLKEAPIRVIEITIKILDAVKYIHENSYPHRDLHDENLFFTSNLEPKIADFGEAFPGSYTAKFSRSTARAHNLQVTELDYSSVGEYFYEMLRNLSMNSCAGEFDDLERNGVWPNEFCAYYPEGFIGEFVKFYAKRQILTLMSRSEDEQKPQNVILHLKDLLQYLSRHFPRFPELF